MANQIRNAAVAVGTLFATGNQHVYTVPDGFVLLFKSLFMSAPGLPPMVVAGLLIGVGGSPQVTFFYTSEPQFGIFNLQTWFAVNGGQQIYLSSSIAPTDYWISGALLPLNPTL